MATTYWLKQTSEQPLFPDLLWSRPENRQAAGKLLIVGGHAYTFAAPASAFVQASDAGIGTARVLLPNSLKKITGHILEEVDFALSTPSGSFSQKALDQLLGMAEWADGVLLAGDFGRNSETAVLIEKFLQKYRGQVTITKDAGDYLLNTPGAVLDRSDTTLVISMGQLQKLAIHAKFSQPFTTGMDLVRLIDALHDFSSIHTAHFIVKLQDQIVVGSAGQISTTKVGEESKVWRVTTAAHAAVWWLQNPSKPFEALTTAIYEASKSS